ncbi:MAG TPA: phosphotransferase [Thermoanaerobaculia bacterium]|jgi:hypothetical protein
MTSAGGGSGVIPSLFGPGLAGLERLTLRTHHTPIAIEALAGDVGRRRYFRLTLPDNRTVLGVVYPPEENDSRRRWVEAHAVLRGRVRVPMLIADDGSGNHLVEDLGTEDLAACFSSASANRRVLLERAADIAAVIAGTPDPGINSPFDDALFRRELNLAREAVFEMYLDSPLSSDEGEIHDRWADALVREILGHPFALCHRDFHGNNLFPAADTIAVIDFQDLRRGPDSYDLASLLWERTTLDWMSEEKERAVLARFASLRGVDPRALGRRLRRVLLQRAWKVCGTFARAVARGKGEIYRRFLPGELALVRSLLSGSDEDRRFGALLKSRTNALC